ncbi:MAG: tail fiber domain-containing protein, partial [Chthoniobacterales bacterium]
GANVASNSSATVGGGAGNEATGPYATIGGGFANIGSGSHSAIGGGSSNTVTGLYATVPGGTRAFATNEGAFVWSGVATVDTASTNTNSFTVRAPGGVRFLTTTATGGDDFLVGVILTNGATAWASLSDSNSKTDFEPVKAREILAKIAAMPVTSWHYKHDLSRRYIGPMAQDFRAAFGLGSDDKTISTLDSDGVMYAAIQGLVQELKDRDKMIDELKTKLESVEQRLNSLPPVP